ncbi:MAG TPA: protein kinase [Vicinamibacteria bacterium]|nr:protein kinase [Vicinamibacteria bacterium]
MLEPGTRVGSYEVLGPLGAGGMGEVYRARDTVLGREVAIKVLPSAFAEDAHRTARFGREAKLLAALNHPGIAHVYGFETVTLAARRDAHVLVMELVEGDDLAAHLARRKLSVDEALDVARQVAQALEEAHERGIVHRDLKPANVKLTPDGKVKVLDFGLAKAWAADSSSPASTADSSAPTLTHTTTQAGAILGTAAYMSPEQARGKTADRRADIWAFGVVLFEALSGRRLFEGDSFSETLAAVLGQEIPWSLLPAGTPPATRRLLCRCLDRDPRQRLQAIGEARIALCNATTGGKSGADRSETARTPIARLLPWLVAMAAVAAAARTLWVPQIAASPSVQQFDLTLPADIKATPSLASGIAQSPDGRMVALLGVKGGTRRLFVRRLDSAETTEVSDSVGVSGAAFSPDSTKIAFCCQGGLSWFSFSDRQRARVALGGDIGSGLAWGESGIVFGRDGTLWIALVGGGEPRRLTALDTSRHEVLHAGPIFLPGGRTVVFTSFAPGAPRIEAVDVDAGARRVVVEGATSAQWSPTGHLLFEREGAILAVPLDAANVRVTGAATPVLPSGRVGRTTSGLLAFTVGANGSLLFVPPDFDVERLVLVARDGSVRPFGLPHGAYSSPQISPDGRRVLISNGWSSLEVLTLARGTRELLTENAPGTFLGVWNRDGTRVAFRRHAIFWRATDGSDRQGEVKGSAGTDYPTGAGPDPDSILVVRTRTETSGDVYLLSLSGSFAPRPLIASRAYEGGAQLSPDGRWLAYSSNETGSFGIRLRRFPELDRRWDVSEGSGTQPRWSPSGQELYYRDGFNLMAVSFDGRLPDPLLGKPQALFPDEYDVGLSTTIPMYDVTRDGRFLMMRREPGSGHLRIVLNWTTELKRILAEPIP